MTTIATMIADNQARTGIVPPLARTARAAELDRLVVMSRQRRAVWACAGRIASIPSFCDRHGARADCRKSATAFQPGDAAGGGTAPSARGSLRDRAASSALPIR